MITTISKWGNSEAIRIPNKILKSSGLSAGDEVQVSETEQGILISRVAKKPKTLKASGILEQYVKKSFSDAEIKKAWQAAVEEKWSEKNC